MLSKYSITVLVCLGCYFIGFLLYSLKHGFPKDSPKLPSMLNLDFLRIFFTLAIVFHHFINKLKIWNAAYFSVEFFFILSGFLLVLSFRPERKTSDFMLNRWIRFTPLVLFGGLLSSLFYSEVKAHYFIENVFLVSSDLPALTRTLYNNPDWYIFVLFWASTLLFYALKYFKKAGINVLAAFIIVAGTIYSVHYGNGEVHGIISARIVRGFTCLGLGYFLAEIYAQLKDHTILHQKLFNLLELGVFLFALLSLFVRPLYQGTIVVYISFMALILLFALRKGAVSAFFNKPIFSKLSKYCLAIYLTHWFLVANIFPIFLKKYNGFLTSHRIIPLIVIPVLACLVGFVAHHAVELPATKFLKKHLEK